VLVVGDRLPGHRYATASVEIRTSAARWAAPFPAPARSPPSPDTRWSAAASLPPLARPCASAHLRRAPAVCLRRARQPRRCQRPGLHVRRPA